MFKVVQILAEFANHLQANLGNPIDLSTIQAFSSMMYKLLAAITQED